MVPVSCSQNAPLPTIGLPFSYARIGRKITILLQLLLLAIVGLSTAFVPSFALYMALRFAVATAVSGYTFSNVALREYLGFGA